jgi:hypothetical protein
MTQFDFNNYIVDRLDKLKLLLTAKGTEYAFSEDAHSNFKNAVGLSLEDTPEKVLWGYCVKHLQSIKDYVDGKDLTHKQLKEKTGDVIAYMLILESMHKEETYKEIIQQIINNREMSSSNNNVDQLKYLYQDGSDN